VKTRHFRRAVTPRAPRSQCRKSLLLPGHFILLAPIERDLPQGRGPVCVPSCLDSVSTKCVVEPSEGSPTMNTATRSPRTVSDSTEAEKSCMIAHSCTSNFEGSFKKRPVETIRLATSHSCFCQAGRPGSSLAWDPVAGPYRKGTLGGYLGDSKGATGSGSRPGMAVVLKVQARWHCQLGQQTERLVP
jgi:hypothetical protein